MCGQAAAQAAAAPRGVLRGERVALAVGGGERATGDQCARHGGARAAVRAAPPAGAARAAPRRAAAAARRQPRAAPHARQVRTTHNTLPIQTHTT